MPEVNIQKLASLIKHYPDTESVFLWGPPGIGKTAFFEQLAEEKKAQYRVFLTSTMDNTDVVGVPHPVGSVTRFLPPEDLVELTEEADYKGPMIACFDDLPASDEQVMASLYRFFYNREVGRLPIRKNVLLCATGNRVEDRSAARETPKALDNRFHHYSLVMSADDWRKWAITAGDIVPELVGYIMARPDQLFTFRPDAKDKAFATPRSVASASRIQQALGNKHPDLYTAIAAAVGDGWAGEYEVWCRNTSVITSPEEILADPMGVDLPEDSDIDLLHATIGGLLVAVQQNLTAENCTAALQYSTRISVTDIGAVLCTDILNNVLPQDTAIRLEVTTHEVMETALAKYGDLYTYEEE